MKKQLAIATGLALMFIIGLILCCNETPQSFGEALIESIIGCVLMFASGIITYKLDSKGKLDEVKKLFP